MSRFATTFTSPVTLVHVMVAPSVFMVRGESPRRFPFLLAVLWCQRKKAGVGKVTVAHRESLCHQGDDWELSKERLLTFLSVLFLSVSGALLCGFRSKNAHVRACVRCHSAGDIDINWARNKGCNVCRFWCWWGKLTLFPNIQMRWILWLNYIVTVDLQAWSTGYFTHKGVD